MKTPAGRFAAPIPEARHERAQQCADDVKANAKVKVQIPMLRQGGELLIVRISDLKFEI